MFDRAVRTCRALTSLTVRDVAALFDAVVLGVNAAPALTVPLDSTVSEGGENDENKTAAVCESASDAPERLAALMGPVDCTRFRSYAANPRIRSARVRHTLGSCCMRAVPAADRAAVESSAVPAVGASPAEAAAVAAARDGTLALGRARLITVAYGAGDAEGALANVGPLPTVAHGHNNHGDAAGAQDEDEDEDEDEDAHHHDEDEDEDGHGGEEDEDQSLSCSRSHSRGDSDGDGDYSEDESGALSPGVDTEEDAAKVAADAAACPPLDMTAVAALQARETALALSEALPAAIYAFKTGLERRN